MKLRLADGARIQSIGRRSTVFIEASQQLFEADALTAEITTLFHAPKSRDEIERTLVDGGMAVASARRYIRSYLLFWSRQGLLQVECEDEDRQSPPFRVVDLAGLRIGIACRDRVILDLLEPVFPPHSAGAGDVEIRYDVVLCGDCVCIAQAGQPALFVLLREAVPALKGRLTEAVMANLGSDTALHGALLENRSGAVLLCAAPGGGKSTLASALTQSGFKSHADDIALLRLDGTVASVPFAPALKSGSWTLLPAMHDLIFAQPVHRRLDGKRVRYLPPPVHIPDQRITLKTIVRLRRKRSGPSATIALEPLQVLSMLVLEAYNPQRRLSATQFESILGVASSVRAFELVYSTLNDAVATLTSYHDAL